MTFATSWPRFKAFLGEACHHDTDLACCTLFLVSFLVPAKRRSVAAAARGIKEMKSYLGMCQYKLGQFRRVQGWVSLCVVAFCYLEWYCGQKQREAPAKEKEVWRRMRSYDLREQVRRETQHADWAGVLRRASTPEGSRTSNADTRNAWRCSEHQPVIAFLLIPDFETRRLPSL